MDHPETFLVIYIGIWIFVAGGIGALIGSAKGRGWAGFWLGVGLGFIGWIIVAVMEPSEAERLRRNRQFHAGAIRERERNEASKTRLSAGDMIELVRSVNTPEGTAVPAGHQAYVVAVGTAKGKVVVRIAAPNGVLFWLSQSAVKRGVASADSKQCPMCAETVQQGAKICRYCRHEFL